MMKQGRGDGADRPVGLGGSGIGALADPTLPSGKSIPTGPDAHLMSGGLGDGLSPTGGSPSNLDRLRAGNNAKGGWLLDEDGNMMPPHHSGTAANAAPALGPTSLDWSVNPHASTQDQVNDIYAAPTIVNPPPAPGTTPATGLAGMRRPLTGKGLRLSEGLR